MANMSLKKVPVPEQAANERNHNFKEVNLGYTAEMAVEEAGRCLQCKKAGVRVRLPGKYPHSRVHRQGGRGRLRCGLRLSRIPTRCPPSRAGCPQESQCECKCVRGIKGESVAIGRLERFVADWYRENVNAMPKKPESNGHKVAVVGSGPAGLSCAADLAKQGYEVSMFEAFHVTGGVLVWDSRVPASQGHCGQRGEEAARLWAWTWRRTRWWARPPPSTSF